MPWINYLGPRITSASSPTLPAATRFIATRGCGGSPATGTTTCRSTVGGRYIYLRDDGSRRVLVAVLAADQPRSTATSAATAWATPTIGSDVRRHRGADALLRAARRDARDLAADGHQRARRRRRELSVFSSIEFCLWDAQDDATNFQRNFNTGEVEVEGRRHLSQDRVPRAPQSLRVLRLLGAARRLRHAARGVPRRVPRLGQARWPSSAAQPVRLDRARLVAARARIRSSSISSPARQADHLRARLPREPA